MLQATSGYPNPAGPAGSPAGGAPYAGNPSVPAAPVPTPDQPLSVLGGRRLSEAERWSLRKLLQGLGTAMGILTSVLTVLVALMMLLALSESRYFLQGGIFLLIGLLLFGVGIGLYQWRYRRLLDKAIHLNEGESEDRAVEIYADRIVSISADRRLTIPFSEIQKAVETPEMFLFYDRHGRFIVLRGADLTPFDAQRVREIVWPRILGVRKEWKGYLLPRLQKPLPIPVFEWEIPMKPVSARRGVTRLREYGPFLLSTLPLFAALGIIIGTGVADEYWITPSYAADTLLFGLMILAGAALLMGGLFAAVLQARKARWKREGELSLLVDLAGSCCLVGNRRFMMRFPKENRTIRRTRKGAEIWFCGSGKTGAKGKKAWVATLSAKELPPAVLEEFLK